MSETIRRVTDKTKNFTIVSNECFRRTDISARAKGLYAYMMTLPDDWKIHKSELYSHFTEGRDALDNAFKELISAGYVQYKKTRDDKNKITGHEYTVYESAPLPGNPLPGNPQLLSTDINEVLSIPSTDNTKEESPNGSLFPYPENQTQKEVKQPNYDEIEKAYFTNFKALYTQGRVAGEKPIIDASWYPKVRKRVKAVAAIVPEEKIVHAINAAMSDDWIVSQGYSLLTILADTQLNKLINGKSQPAKTGMTRQRTTMLDMREA